MDARTLLSLRLAPDLVSEPLGVRGSPRRVPTLLSLLLISAPLAQAVSSCEVAIRLDALTVSSNISKVGFPAFIPDRQNPTVFFRKTVNTRQTLNNACYICHEQGNRTTSDTWQYDALTGAGPNQIAWSGSSTYHAETNGQTTVDCFATRTGPSSWSDPSCQTLSVFTPDVTSSNRTPSAYTLVLTREEEVLITVPQGSAVRRVSESSTLEINLASPYSLSDFVNSTSAQLQAAPWPPWTRATGNAFAERGGRNVVNYLSDDRAEFKASLTKLKYRIAVRGPRNQKHTISWIERFTPNGGGPVLDTPFTEEITFSGQEQFLIATSGEHGKVIEPPAQTGKIEVLVAAGAPCDTPSCQPGNGRAYTGSIDVEISLGRTPSGESAGFLQLKEDFPAPDLASPQRLHYFVSHDVDVITDGSLLRQIRAPQTLVQLVPDPAGYELRFHPPTTNKDVNGYYLPGGQPSFTWRIESPDHDPGRLRVLELGPGNPLVSNYEWSALHQAWVLTCGDVRKEIRSSTQTNGLRTEKFSILEMDDRVVYREVRTWRQYGGLLGDLLVYEQIGSEDNPLATSWTYYDDPADDRSYGKLRSVSRSIGGMQSYEYDDSGRLSTVRGTFLYTPAGRVTQYSYTPVDPLDDGTKETNSARATIDYVLGKEIHRRYQSVRTNETLVIQCQTPGASWDDPLNLITTSRTGTTPAFDGTIESIAYPDGTMRITRNPTNRSGAPRTHTVDAGEPNLAGTEIVDGSRTTTTFDSAGRVTSRATTDIRSSTTLSSEIHDYPDDFSPATRITYLDGTSTTTIYDCCQATASVDRDGTLTTYTRDELGRLTSATRNGITQLYSYDAADNLVATRRQGTDGTVILLNQATYDLAGRQISSTDAAASTTLTFSGTLSGEVDNLEITTFPDGSTRTELYAADGSLMELYGDAANPTRFEYGVDQDEDSGFYRFFVKETKTTASGSDTPEWTKTCFDMLDRPYKIVHSDNTCSQSFFNNSGQLWKRREPDGRVTLYAYNARGEVEYTATDVDESDTIDLSGADRVTRTLTDVFHGRPRTRTYVWPTVGSPESLLVATRETSPDGRQNLETRFGATTATQTDYLGNGVRRIVETAPDSSRTIRYFRSGLLLSVSRAGANGEDLGATTYGYDSHGRLSVANDSRTGVCTNYFYSDSDQVTQILNAARADLPATITAYAYDEMGRMIRATSPDGGTQTNQYTATGQLKATSGAHTYPVECAYDAQGRLTNMLTLSLAGTSPIRWSYDEQRGWLRAKRYADDFGPSYSHTASGRLNTRTSARGVTTSYTYNRAGDLQAVDYHGNGSNIEFLDFDRLGRPARINLETNVSQLAYHHSGQIVSETFGHLIVTNDLDSCLRPRTVALYAGESPVPLLQCAFGYDGSSRLQTVTAGALTVGYSYLPKSALVQDVMFRFNGKLQMISSRAYDHLNRLTSIASAPAGASALLFGYRLGSTSQRRVATEADGSRWAYEYDLMGQLIGGRKFWNDGTPVAGQQFEYAFDLSGTRARTRTGGDSAGTGLRTASYSANLLNQYTSRDVPPARDLFGQAPVEAVITVNGLGTYRKGNYFELALVLNNSSGPVLQNVTNQAWLWNDSRLETGGVFLPSSPETFAYDRDGNLTDDGRWALTWDVEDRLVGVEARGDIPVTARQKLIFDYDYRGRRTAKTVMKWNPATGGYQFDHQTKFVYDDGRLLAELNETNTLLRSYVWGADLSGTPNGAGGISGLLAMLDYRDGPAAYFYAYDGNGNVRALIDANASTFAALYDYGPFGELLRATGPMARGNPFRFSTKYQDDETDLVYYGHRWYDPGTGRWLSRDPKQELGGPDLYVFVGNDPLNAIDPWGLEEFTSITVKRKQVQWLALLRSQLGKKPAPDDPYGHWWLEFDGESYGWWPKDGVTLLQTLTTVPARLNGTDDMHASGMASETRDGHQGDSADEEFHPRRRTGLLSGASLQQGSAVGTNCKCVTEEEVKDCLRAFAKQYRGSWSYPWGQNCHSFQKAALRACCLKK